MNIKLFVRRWSLRFSIAYFLAVATCCAWYWLGAIDGTVSTLYLYGPRWVAFLPMLLLLPFSLGARSRIGARHRVGIREPRSRRSR